MNRFRQLLLASCIALGLLSSSWVHAQGDPAARLTTGSVWRGTLLQPSQAGQLAYPVVIYVAQRTGNTFTGNSWYPSLGSGLLKITGQITTNGTVTFSEEVVAFGAGWVAAGSMYPGTIEGTTWLGKAEFPNGTAGRFSLKLAE